MSEVQEAWPQLSPEDATVQLTADSYLWAGFNRLLRGLLPTKTWLSRSLVDSTLYGINAPTCREYCHSHTQGS